jgi:glycosyltransferase involved in cell wall biosynthesis
VPHGVSDIHAGSLSRAEQRRSRGDAPLRVLYVSRLEARKGTDLFLEAAAELVKHYPDVEVVVAGRDAYESEPHRSYRARFEATNRDLKDRIRFYGEVSHFELERLYEQSDIFCVPSRFESFGIVFIEAMRYGVPVVAGNTGGAPEIVAGGETGIVCKEHTSEAFASALSRLVIDRELRLRLGNNGRRRYLELFENEIVTDRTLSAFIGVMDSGRTFG